MAQISTFADWLKTYEAVAIWLEGIALVAIFWLDYREYKKQNQEREAQEEEREHQREAYADQHAIWRKQIHADRVARIFFILREFSSHLGRIRATARMQGLFGPYLATQHGEHMSLDEAYYTALLVSEELAEFVDERRLEADALHMTDTAKELLSKIDSMRDNWDVRKLATSIRKLY